MNLFSHTLITVGTIVLFYYLYKMYKLYQKKPPKEKKCVQTTLQKDIIEEVKPKPKKLYRLETQKIEYSFYNPSFDGLQELDLLYELVVRKNFWIDEPFHTKFYQFLMLINDNQFMIIDPHSKVITMNVRDRYNKIQTSKSYQVYSTKDIIKHMIYCCIDDITRLNKNDAQNLVISIFIVALKQSVHYLSKDVPQNVIDKMLKDYEQAQMIKNIVHMIETKNEKVYFIQESLYDAFSVVETLPYNDSEVPKAIKIREQLPQKLLHTI